MPTPSVVDLSHWNPEPSFDDMALAGVIGVILKATEGSTYVDPTYVDRREDAKAAGLCVSSYHFLKHGMIADQAWHYLITIGAAEGERVCVDHEDTGATLDDLKAFVREILERRPDLQVTVYSGHLIKEQLGGARDEFLAENTSLWIAQYTSADSPEWPYATWPTWSLWQYTDKADVPGCPNPVDGNRWNGTADNLVAWFGPAVPAPEPAPEPGKPFVEVAISCPDNVEIVVKINGMPVASKGLEF